MKYILTVFFILQSFLYAQQLELSATVISDNEKLITSRNMGFIKSVNVAEGDTIRKGETLYSIDSTEIDSKKQQALLGVQMYESQYETMKRNLERYKRLYDKGLVAKFDVEQLELGTKNLEDMVNISKARVKEVENQYKYLTIKAPNDGVIIKKNIKAGEMAIPGMSALILTDLSSLTIKAEISEGDLFKVKQEDSVKVEIPSLKYNTTGTIKAIIPSSNPMSHTYMIKVSFKTIPKIYPGMYAKIYIEVQ